MLAAHVAQEVGVLPGLTVLNEGTVTVVVGAAGYVHVELTRDTGSFTSRHAAKSSPAIRDRGSTMMGNAGKARDRSVDEARTKSVVPVENHVLVAEVFVVRQVHVAGAISSRQILIEEEAAKQEIFRPEVVVDTRQVLILIEAVFVVG